MTIISGFELPASAADLPLPTPGTPWFLLFIASDDPATGQPWCSDVRASLPTLKAAFAPESSPEVAIVEVGQRPAWRQPDNIYRTKWNVHNVPALLRYENIGNEIKETGRLVESEILEPGRLKAFIGKA